MRTWPDTAAPASGDSFSSGSTAVVASAATMRKAVLKAATPVGSPVTVTVSGVLVYVAGRVLAG